MKNTLLFFGLVLSNIIGIASASIQNTCKVPFLDHQFGIETIATDQEWPEGPVWSTELNGLLFSDVGKDRIMLWQPNATPKLSVFLNASGHSGSENRAWGGSNGLFIINKDNNNKDNNEELLLIAQHGDRAVMQASISKKLEKQSLKLVVNDYQGKRLNSPNDLAVSNKNTLFFTDPPYGLSGFEKSDAIELPYFAVFKKVEGRSAEPIITNLKKPNGIALNRQNDVLYVSDSSDDENKIWRYQLDENEDIISTSLFVDGGQKNMAGNTDGLTVLDNGMLVASVPGGIALFNDQGQQVDFLALGQVTNVEVDSDESYLFVTAPPKVLRFKVANSSGPELNCFFATSPTTN